MPRCPLTRSRRPVRLGTGPHSVLTGALLAGAVLAGAALAGGLLTGCGSANTGAAGVPLDVVATGNFWGDIAAQVGGDRARVRSVGGEPGADPHLYEAGARDAAAVADADLVIINGLGYDDAIARLAADRDDNATLDISKVLDAPDDANPHLWYDVLRVPQVAAAIAERLSAIDPEGRDSYARNLDAFRSSLQPVLDRIATIRSQHAGTRIANTERVAGYLLDAMGLVVASPPGFATAIEEGNEPSAADTQAMDRLLRSGTVPVLVYNEQAESPVTERAAATARGQGVAVVGVTETLPAGDADYQAWQGRQTTAIQEALSR